ncbi:hypothetical protein HanIR_Chr16g0819661 [Helianthus annuus]|nr:hypothetical protein HanIR_Chr16g0819661 [Helianthus annuus]
MYGPTQSQTANLFFYFWHIYEVVSRDAAQLLLTLEVSAHTCSTALTLIIIRLRKVVFPHNKFSPFKPYDNSPIRTLPFVSLPPSATGDHHHSSATLLRHRSPVSPTNSVTSFRMHRLSSGPTLALFDARD